MTRPSVMDRQGGLLPIIVSGFCVFAVLMCIVLEWVYFRPRRTVAPLCPVHRGYTTFHV